MAAWLNEAMTTPKSRRKKSTYAAFFSALAFGPLGLLYVSWQRAVIMFLLFLLGVLLFPDEAIVVVGLWLIAPASSVLAMSVVPRRPPLASMDRNAEQLAAGDTSQKA